MSKLPPDVVTKVRRLARIADDLRRGKNYSITRLTTIKSLCREPRVAARFALHMAKLTRDRIGRETRPTLLEPEEWKAHKRLIAEAVRQAEGYLRRPSPKKQDSLWELLREIVSSQDEFKRIYGGPVRQIKDMKLLLVEDALQCILRHEEAPAWAYNVARDHAERYESGYAIGLVPRSATLVDDIVEFWSTYYGVKL